MAPKPKWAPEQQEFIHVWMPEFLLKKGKKGLDIFWPKMKTAFFNEWPEELVLGLPLQQVNSDANAERPPPLNAEEKTQLEDALEARTAQLKNSFFNAYAKIRTQSGGVGKSALSLAATLFKARPKARRRHQVLEIYQKLYKAKVRAALMNSGYERENEAAQCHDNEGEWVDDDDDEVKMNRMAMARSNRMKIWRQVVQELWDAEPEEVQEKIQEEAKKEVLPVKTDEEVEDGERTPKEYEMSVKESMQVAEMFLAEFQRMTGWMGVLVYGGPIARLKGKLGVKAVPFGLAPGGLGFDRWHPAWEKGVTNPLFKFLRQAIPRDVRLRRSIFTGEETDDENDSDTETPVKKKSSKKRPDGIKPATQVNASKKKSKATEKPAPAETSKPARRPKKTAKKAQATVPAPVPPAAASERALSLDATPDRDLGALEGVGGGEPAFSGVQESLDDLVADVFRSQESQDDFVSQAGGTNDFLDAFLSQGGQQDFPSQLQSTFMSQGGGNPFSQRGQDEGAQQWGGWDTRYNFADPEASHLGDSGIDPTPPPRRRIQISACRAQLAFDYPGVLAFDYPGVLAFDYPGVLVFDYPGRPTFDYPGTPVSAPQNVLYPRQLRTHPAVSCVSAQLAYRRWCYANSSKRVSSSDNNAVSQIDDSASNDAASFASRPPSVGALGCADPEAYFFDPEVVVPSDTPTSATPPPPHRGRPHRPHRIRYPPACTLPHVPAIKTTGELSKAGGGEAVAGRSRKEDGGGEDCEEEGAGKEGASQDAKGEIIAARMKAAEEEEKKSAAARKAENMRLFNPDGPSQLYITRTKRTVHAPSNRGPVLSLKERGEALDAKSRAEDDLLLKALNGNGKKRKGATEENRAPAKKAKTTR
ncbi:hypothetical protein C8R44DRAFT_885452 [Mycena epipterygia]|nr:hypothetical protein C8R44DRAFT_885452 [Mycena epipterygia]